nr:hypothetical protein [Kofleriaceae bacterium]
MVGAGGLIGSQVLARLPGARGVRRGEALRAAVADAAVVVNCAGPLALSAPDVCAAALAAGAHYIDVGGEQAPLHELHERGESAARHAGRLALPGMGVDCAVGDLAAAWAASALAGEPLTGDLVRGEPPARVADAQELDAVTVTYVYDDLVLSAGSQRALFAATGARPLVWRRDRWEPGAGGRRVNAGAAFGGERDAMVFGGGDAITVPRHVAAASVASYVSTTRSAAASGALRFAARALPLLPERARARLVAYADPGADHTRTRFCVIAEARRAFADARVIVRGVDPYRTTATIAAWAARAIADRGLRGPLGVRSPAEVFRADLALRALASEAGLVIEGP